MHLRVIIALPHHHYREEVRQAGIAQRTTKRRHRVSQRKKILMIKMKYQKKSSCLRQTGQVGCAIEVHKQLGSELLESIYRECLYNELKEFG